MKKHPNKHIREAIEYAVENGWDIVETGKSGHAFCRLKCVLGHAKQILRKVKQCNGDEQ